MRYFARVTAGLEQTAWQDIARRAPAQLIGFGHRRIDFHSDAAPSALLALRSVDDVYVYVDLLRGLDHTRASLATIAQQIAQVDFTQALCICQQARGIAQPPSYSVTASHLGRRNYSRHDIEQAAQSAIGGRLPWRFIPNQPGANANAEADLDLRILLEDGWALLGLRLGARPLHRRAYKVESMPGSLKAPVAYCLCALAQLQPDDRVLDPMCGAGTILIEAADLAHSGALIGADIQQQALAAARQNIQASGHEPRPIQPNSLAPEQRSAGLRFYLYQGDARTPQLPRASISAVVSNPPWDLQVSTNGDTAAFYTAMLAHIAYVLAPQGRALLLSTQAEAFQLALGSTPSLLLRSAAQISLFGQHPWIYLLDRLGG